jgi:hypothetical protein
VPKRVRGGHCSAGVFERLRDIDGNKGLILNDEDRAPMESWAFHEVSRGAAKRETARGGGLPQWAARCPELSINPQSRNKRDNRLGRPSPAELRRGRCCVKKLHPSKMGRH